MKLDLIQWVKANPIPALIGFIGLIGVVTYIKGTKAKVGGVTLAAEPPSNDFSSIQKAKGSTPAIILVQSEHDKVIPPSIEQDKFTERHKRHNGGEHEKSYPQNGTVRERNEEDNNDRAGVAIFSNPNTSNVKSFVPYGSDINITGPANEDGPINFYPVVFNGITGWMKESNIPNVW